MLTTGPGKKAWGDRSWEESMERQVLGRKHGATGPGKKAWGDRSWEETMGQQDDTPWEKSIGQQENRSWEEYGYRDTTV